MEPGRSKSGGPRVLIGAGFGAGYGEALGKEPAHVLVIDRTNYLFADCALRLIVEDACAVTAYTS